MGHIDRPASLTTCSPGVCLQSIFPIVIICITVEFFYSWIVKLDTLHIADQPVSHPRLAKQNKILIVWEIVGPVIGPIGRQMLDQFDTLR